MTEVHSSKRLYRDEYDCPLMNHAVSAREQYFDVNGLRKLMAVRCALENDCDIATHKPHWSIELDWARCSRHEELFRG